MLANFCYVSNVFLDNCIDVYQLANAFGDIPKFMKVKEGAYVFCVLPDVNIEKICHNFGYCVQGNPISVIIDSNKYNSFHKVDNNFSLIKDFLR